MSTKSGLSALRSKRKGIGNSNTIDTDSVSSNVKSRMDFNDTYPISNPIQDCTYNDLDNEEVANSYMGSAAEDFFKSRTINEESDELTNSFDNRFNSTDEIHPNVKHIDASEVDDLGLVPIEVDSSPQLPSQVFPTVRSLINKDAVVESVPKLKLEVICDSFVIELKADNLETLVNDFRLKCFGGGLEDTTKSISISYCENMNLYLESIKTDVKSDLVIENMTEFDSDTMTVGAAIQVLFDRLGIGYLLD